MKLFNLFTSLNKKKITPEQNKIDPANNNVIKANKLTLITDQMEYPLNLKPNEAALVLQGVANSVSAQNTDIAKVCGVLKYNPERAQQTVLVLVNKLFQELSGYQLLSITLLTQNAESETQKQLENAFNTVKERNPQLVPKNIELSIEQHESSISLNDYEIIPSTTNQVSLNT